MLEDGFAIVCLDGEVSVIVFDKNSCDVIDTTKVSSFESRGRPFVVFLLTELVPHHDVSQVYFILTSCFLARVACFFATLRRQLFEGVIDHQPPLH